MVSTLFHTLVLPQPVDYTPETQRLGLLSSDHRTTSCQDMLLIVSLARMVHTLRGYHVTHHASFLEPLRLGSMDNDIFVVLVPSPTRNSLRNHNWPLEAHMQDPHLQVSFQSKARLCHNFRKSYESAPRIGGWVGLVSSFDYRASHHRRIQACYP